MAFEGTLQISRSPPEFSQNLPDIARQIRQFFRPKYHQNYHEDYNQVWNAEHWGLRAPLRLAVLAYTEPQPSKRRFCIIEEAQGPVKRPRSEPNVSGPNVSEIES
jgi:hypothetical protein